MIKESDIPILNSILKKLESSIDKLQSSYQKKNSEKFNELKKAFIQEQRKIMEMAK